MTTISEMRIGDVYFVTNNQIGIILRVNTDPKTGEIKVHWFWPESEDSSFTFSESDWLSPDFVMPVNERF